MELGGQAGERKTMPDARMDFAFLAPAITFSKLHLYRCIREDD